MLRIIAIVSLLGACSEPDPATVAQPPSVLVAPDEVLEVEGPAIVVEASHGGDMVVVGNKSVEVVVHDGGHVYAYPPDDDFAEATFVVRVPIVDGDPRRVPLRWNRRSHRFEGRLRRVEVAPGPVTVVLDHHGHHYDADVRIRLAPRIRIEVDSPVLEVRGKHRKHRKHRGRGRGRMRGHGRGPGIDIRIR